MLCDLEDRSELCQSLLPFLLPTLRICGGREKLMLQIKVIKYCPEDLFQDTRTVN